MRGRRFRPLEPGEQRSVDPDENLTLESMTPEETVDYMLRWPDAPLSRYLKRCSDAAPRHQRSTSMVVEDDATVSQQAVRRRQNNAQAQNTTEVTTPGVTVDVPNEAAADEARGRCARQRDADHDAQACLNLRSSIRHWVLAHTLRDQEAALAGFTITNPSLGFGFFDASSVRETVRTMLDRAVPYALPARWMAKFRDESIDIVAQHRHGRSVLEQLVASWDCRIWYVTDRRVRITTEHAAGVSGARLLTQHLAELVPFPPSDADVAELWKLTGGFRGFTSAQEEMTVSQLKSAIRLAFEFWRTAREASATYDRPWGRPLTPSFYVSSMDDEYFVVVKTESAATAQSESARKREGEVPSHSGGATTSAAATVGHRRGTRAVASSRVLDTDAPARHFCPPAPGGLDRPLSATPADGLLHSHRWPIASLRPAVKRRRGETDDGDVSYFWFLSLPAERLLNHAEAHQPELSAALGSIRTVVDAKREWRDEDVEAPDWSTAAGPYADLDLHC